MQSSGSEYGYIKSIKILPKIEIRNSLLLSLS